MITLYQIDTNTAEAYTEKSNKRLYRFDMTSEDLTKDIFKLYSPVAKFITDDLDEAFEIDNTGDESKVFASTKHHSMSVGDIVTINNSWVDNGVYGKPEWFMVSRLGFDKIDPKKYDVTYVQNKTLGEQ